MEDKGTTSKNEISSVMGVSLGVSLDKRILSWMAALAFELVIIAVVAVLFLVPQVGKWNELNRDIKKEGKLLESKNNKVQLIADLSVVMDPTEETLRMALPRSKDIGLLLSSLRQQTAQVGVKMETYTLNPGEVSGVAVTKKVTSNDSGLPIELTVSGRIEALRKFLDLINTSLPIKKVDSVQVVSSEIREEVRLKLKLVMYFMPFSEKDVANNPLRELNKNESELLNAIQTWARYSQKGNDVNTVPLGNSNLFGL